VQSVRSTPHCLEWYKFVLRIRLPTVAVRFLAGLFKRAAKEARTSMAAYRLSLVWSYMVLTVGGIFDVLSSGAAEASNADA